jgi:hypothetical protein
MSAEETTMLANLLFLLLGLAVFALLYLLTARVERW